MTRCTICNIVAGRIPAWVIYQDDDVICFLPATLQAYGHTAIATKAHYADLFTTPESLLTAVFCVAKKLAVHYRDKIGASGVNILHASGASAQQSVPHLHIHLLPRFEDDGLNAWPQLTTVPCDRDELLQKLQLLE